MKPNDQAYQAALRATSDSCSAYQIQNALDAAYAAQFQSEDYAGLVKELREECRDWLTADCVTKAADALEAVLAERDALLARLAPVDDEALVKIAAAAIRRNKFERTRRLDCFDPSNLTPEELGEGRAAIAAIRPHIEAAERERCVKAVKKVAGMINVPLHERPEYEDGYLQGVHDAAAAIRSGK